MSRSVYPVMSTTPSIAFGAFAKLRKSTISFVMSLSLSVRMEQLGSLWTDIDETFFENL